MLVPEIALTPQIVARFVERFGDTVAVLHSQAVQGRALRRVAAPAPRRGAHLRRPALGGVRADHRPRAHRHRRGARPVLQARGRPAVRRAAGGRAPRRDARRAAARPRGPSRRTRCAASRLPERVDGPRLPPREVLDMRGTSSALHPETVEALHGARQGDRAAQPPRVVELPDLPLVRARVDVPGVRRLARAPPRPGPLACHHCGHRERVPHEVHGVRGRSASRATARAPSGSSTSSRPPAWRSSASTPTSRGPPTCCAAFERAGAASSSGRRWSPRATTSRT